MVPEWATIYPRNEAEGSEIAKAARDVGLFTSVHLNPKASEPMMRVGSVAYRGQGIYDELSRRLEERQRRKFYDPPDY